MGLKYKKTLKLGKNTKIKLTSDSGITIITKFKEGHISINKKGIMVYGENGVIKHQKQLWIFKKKKINIKEFKISKIERRIKVKNKKNIIKKILSYDKDLNKGINKYRNARKNFWIYIPLSIILSKNLIVSFMCIIFAIYFSIRAFKLIKYKKIYTIVKQVGTDLSFMNLYDEEKINFLIEKFRNNYSEDAKEYKELINVFNKFKNTGKRTEKELNNLEVEDISYYLKTRDYEQNNLNKEERIDESNDLGNEKNEGLKYSMKSDKVNNRTINYRSSFEENPLNNLAILYRKEEKKSDGIKKIKKVVEFFDDIDGIETITKKDKAVISKDNNKLTVYFYKKSSIL
ncbi:hypothetical protein [Clostridium uliginosum]|uniref:Uncharacterized protein n=1 Tax=Clostridium uliginosum TaxID=119641 RepID=A0A1I1RLR8_9CLOT|nr:hypothetical protein [Clostridium uliginosum]SFD35092.1 hypothetical protein SAMN05421842_13516 [Clostridium uliginosum]